MNTSNDHQTSAVAATQRAAPWRPRRTDRVVAALLSVLTSSLLLASVAVGMAGTVDATLSLADRGASSARA